MRIGFDIRTVGKRRTGDETVTLQLVNNLLGLKGKDRFFLFTDEKDQVVLDVIENKFKVGQEKLKRFEICSITPTQKAFWTLFSLPNFIRKSPIDVLHVQYITPLILSKKVKLVTTVHDISFARYPKYISKKDLLLLKIFIPLSLKRADKIIAVSEFTKREIMDVYGVDESKIEVVYNGGAAERFFVRNTQSKMDVFRKKRKLEDDFLLYVGTLQPRKNIPFLMQSFVEFKQRFAAKDGVGDLNLVIGGNRAGHNYDKQIDRKFDEIKRKFPNIAKNIIFAGFIKDEELPLFYQAARGVCIASEYEGFGLPAIEAMASRTPVLSTDASCMPEICAQSAMLYKHNDSEDFITKLEQVVCNNDLRKELVDAGEKRAREFSWGKAAKQTLAVYQSV